MKVETIPDRRLMGVRIAAPGFCFILMYGLDNEEDE